MIASNSAFRRTLFILQEIVNDLGIQKQPYFYQFLTVVIAVGLLYVRMFIHYMSQYLMLKFMDAPVTSITFDYYKVHMDYASWNVYQEMLVTASGPIGNSIMFIFLSFCCWIS